MNAAAKKLPWWTGEFSPGQLGSDALVETLRIVSEFAGDRSAVVEQIRLRWFTESASKRSNPAERLKQQSTRAGNVLIGMQKYGLVNKRVDLTALGLTLLTSKTDDERHRLFGAHILKDMDGLELLDVVRTIKSRSVKVSNDSLRTELRDRGFAVTNNSADAGKLRQWLELAKVITKDWSIDESVVAELTGAAAPDIDDWRRFTAAQRAILSTLRHVSEARGAEAVGSPELLEKVRTTYGPVFDEGQVRLDYKLLADTGWIKHEVKVGGRGGKGGTLTATDKLLNVDLELLSGISAGDLPADLRSAKSTPLAKIYADLRSTDTHVKGLALELLAVRMSNDLGLVEPRLRVRSADTGGAEVDLIVEDVGQHFSRWLFQCKNTRNVTVGVVAKELGVAKLLHAHVVVVVSTGSFSAAAAAFARKTNELTDIQIVLLDSKAVDEYQRRGALALRERFRQEALNALQLKRAQLAAGVDAIGLAIE